MSSSRLEVLIVDDSAVARQVLSAVLGAAGMDVRVAPDPLFALQKLKRSEPDVVVLDLEMPRMDGITFLKQLSRERPIPVVICSGTTDGRGAKAIEALEHGAVEVVTKPKTAVREFLFESSVMLVDAVMAAAATRPKLRAPRMSSAPSAGRRTGRGALTRRIEVCMRMVPIGVHPTGTHGTGVHPHVIHDPRERRAHRRRAAGVRAG